MTKREIIKWLLENVRLDEVEHFDLSIIPDNMLDVLYYTDDRPFPEELVATTLWLYMMKEKPTIETSDTEFDLPEDELFDLAAAFGSCCLLEKLRRMGVIENLHIGDPFNADVKWTLSEKVMDLIKQNPDRVEEYFGDIRLLDSDGDIMAFVKQLLKFTKLTLN